MTASAPVPVPPSATRGALGFWPRFVDVDCPPAQLGSIKAGDCLFTFIGVRHFDECESARTARLTVGQNADTVHLPIRFKGLP